MVCNDKKYECSLCKLKKIEDELIKVFNFKSRSPQIVCKKCLKGRNYAIS